LTELSTTFTFRCPRFRPTPGELDEQHDDYINPGVFAKEAASFIADALNRSGYRVTHVIQEDWGRSVEVEKPDRYFLAVGVGNYDEEERRDETTETHMIFVEPDKSPIRKWFRKIQTEERVMQLVATLRAILEADEGITDVKSGRRGDL
jgi:hypothetical protein